MAGRPQEVAGLSPGAATGQHSVAMEEDEDTSPFSCLPDALLLKIMQLAAVSTPRSPFQCACLCSRWRRVVSEAEDGFWRLCFMQTFGERALFWATSEQMHLACQAPEIGTQACSTPSVTRPDLSRLEAPKDRAERPVDNPDLSSSPCKAIRRVALSEPSERADAIDEFPHRRSPQSSSASSVADAGIHSASASGGSRWKHRFRERLVASRSWRQGLGKSSGVSEAMIKAELDKCERIGRRQKENLLSEPLHFSAMKLECNLLFLAVTPSRFFSPSVCPIVVWDLEKGSARSVCVGHENKVWSLEADRWCRFLLSGSEVDEIRVWDVETGRCLWHLPSKHPEMIWPWEILRWIDRDYSGVERIGDPARGPLVPKPRKIEEWEEWLASQPQGEVIRSSSSSAPTSFQDDACDDFWVDEGKGLDSSVPRPGAVPRVEKEAQGQGQGGSGGQPGGKTVRASGVPVPESLLWVSLTTTFERTYDAIIWQATPHSATPFPIRRFNQALAFSNRTCVIALQGSTPLQVQLAHVITGEPLGIINLPTPETPSAADSALVAAAGAGVLTDEAAQPRIEEAYFSHSSEAGWCLVVILESGMLLLADVSSGGILAKVQCGAQETFHSLALLGRVYALVCPRDDTSSSRSASLWDIECQRSFYFEELNVSGEWHPLHIDAFVSEEPSATSIWMGSDEKTILLWTEPGGFVAKISSACMKDTQWNRYNHLDANWRWLAVQYAEGIFVNDFAA